MKRSCLVMWMLTICGAFLSGCTSNIYVNHNERNEVTPIGTYAKVIPNLFWSNTYEDEGCSLTDFYKVFEKSVDEILHVSITERKETQKLLTLKLSQKSHCEYHGTGVLYNNKGRIKGMGSVKTTTTNDAEEDDDNSNRGPKKNSYRSSNNYQSDQK